MEWNTKTLEHDHSYNKNDSDDMITTPAEVSVSDSNKNEIIIQSIKLINDDEDDVSNIELADFQIASADVEHNEIENPDNKQKIIHFELVSPDGNTFSVSSLELQPDDEVVDMESLGKRGMTESVDEMVQDMSALEDIDEESNLLQVEVRIFFVDRLWLTTGHCASSDSPVCRVNF